MPDTAAPPLPHPGLSPAEVEASRRAHGGNVLTPPERVPLWKQFLEKFEDPVIRILIIAAVIQIGVNVYKQEFPIEGLAIVAAILLATFLAFINEYKANREFDILNQVNDDVPIKVIREGRFQTAARRDIVVDDVILIETGDEAPCDGEVLDAVSLLSDESKLTGESEPVSKFSAVVAAARPPRETAYPASMVYRGTMVADGHGTVRATAVGDRSELGKTAKAAGEDDGEETPLNRQLEKLSKWIGVVGLGVAALTFAALVGRAALTDQLRGPDGLPIPAHQWYFAGVLLVAVMFALVRVWLPIVYDGLNLSGVEVEPPAWLEREGLGGWAWALAAGAVVLALGAGGGVMAGWLPSDPGQWFTRSAAEALLNYFMIAVVIIVVAVPEGLAMSVTLSLAYSMRKMTAQNTLVRKMHACETIGAATVICSDKTGTLTQNVMAVAVVKFPALTGTPTGLIVDAAAVNSTAQLTVEDGVSRPLGNPTEGAMLAWLDGQGVNYLNVRAGFTVTGQLPFSTERKYMGTVGTDRGGAGRLHLKGAPEMVLARCTRVLTPNGPASLGEAERQAIHTELVATQGRAMRTIGLAYKDVPAPGAEVEPHAEELVWLGFFGITDPVRLEVPAAVAACRRAGIDVKIVTGDTPDTAREVGRQVGLLTGDEGPGAEMTGPAFAALSDEDASAATTRLKVLSRARPMDKLRLVRLLTARGEVVAVTGDGTNDAPALNYAAVGLAMGKSGTAVAKEAADVVLLDDSFGSVVTAVRWGRGLYENIQRFILFQLTINVVALGVALLGPFLGVDFPLTVMQMLWVNLIMDTFAALALATEPPTEAVLSRPPRHPEAFIITGPMARLIFSVGGVFLVIMLAMVFILPELRSGVDMEWTRAQEHAQAHGGTAPADLKARYDTFRWSATVFFSVFVMLQFWNLFNARTLGTGRSAFAGFFRNPSFLLIAAVILVGQVLLVQFGGDVFRTVPLSAVEWGVILVATLPVLVIGEVARATRKAA